MDMLAAANTGKRFLFSRLCVDASTPLRASDTVAELAASAEPKLQEPSRIRCTKLRKRLATMSQLLNLKKNELEQLANHMGHDIVTHSEYYRLPMETVLIAKMSKLLSLAHEGRTHEFKGKSLNEISLDPDEALTPYNDDDQSDEDLSIDKESETSECRDKSEKSDPSWSQRMEFLPKQRQKPERKEKDTNNKIHHKTLTMKSHMKVMKRKEQEQKH